MTELKPGANAARNKGLKAANGDYLYFFDSDDLLYPHSLETVYRHLYKNGFPELIAFPFILRYPDGKTSRRPHRYSVDPASQLFDMVIPTHGVCFKRSFVEKTGLWDNHLFRWQDLEFGFRLLLHAEKLVWIKEAPLYEVRVHPDSISGKTFTEDHALLHATLAKIQRIIDQLPPGKSTERMQRALCFKTVSMASQIKLEKSRTLSKHYLAEAIDKLPTARYKTSRCLLKIHYFYSGMGGRGFWRLAEKWL